MVVKEQRDLVTRELIGYLVDGVKFVPIDANNADYKEIVEYIASGGYVEQAFSLEDEKRFKLQELRSAYISAINANIAYLGTEFQADEKSQDMISKVLSASGGTLPTDFFWVDAFNNQVPMTYADLQGLANEILLRGQAAFAKLQTLKAQVNSAATVADVNAIIW